jgi:sugar lactone lactonase YvrE/acetyl esterase/lipase
MTPPVAASSDVAYVTPLQPDVTEQRLDVYTPSEAGDWPVVVLLHGYDATKEYYAPLSQAIAEQGAVVFTAAWPTWIADLAARDNGKGFREMSEVLSCAIRFARATAPDYGGDPSQVTLVGHSYGADAGAWVALAGDDLDRSWEELALIRGGPPPQVECVVSGVSADVDAYVGIGGGYDFAGPLQERDPELWQIADAYAHLGQNVDLRVRLIHGERDSTVEPEHAVQFNDALVEAGYDTSLTLWDGKHQVPTELTVAEVMKVAGEPAITPETAEMEPADKPEVVNSFDASRGELPEGIAIDTAGDIYVSLGPPLFVGGGFGEIWKISPDGTETVLAQFHGGPPAAGLALDASSNLYYAYPVDEGDDRGGVYRLTDDGSTERLPGTENIILPNGLAFDNDGNLYVSDSILGAIWRIPSRGSAELWLQHDLLAGCLPDDPFGANGVALWEGNLFAANTGKGILVYIPILADGSAGEPEAIAGAGDCDAEVKQLYGMDGIALDAEGSVYAVLVLQNKLVKIDPADGSFTTLLTEHNGLHNPASITFGIGEDNQSILFTNYAVLPPVPAASPGPAVQKFDVGVPGEPAITPENVEVGPADKPKVVNSFDAEGSEFPEGIAMDSAGNIYASLGLPFWMGGDAGEIRRISPDGTEAALVTIAGPPAAGLAIDSAGTLFYAYPTGDERTGVFRVNDDGTTERLPGTENIVLPNGLAFDGQGNLYATDTILGTVWRIPPDGTGEAEAWFQHEWLQGCKDDPMGANGIALWQDSFYVASTVKGLLVRVPIIEDGSAGEPELVAGTADCDAEFDELDSMDGIAVAEDGSIYALLVIQNKAVRIDPNDGSSTVLLTDADGLWNPASITFGTGKDNQESIFFTNFAVLPPEPANSLGPAVLEFDVGVQGLPLP